MSRKIRLHQSSSRCLAGIAGFTGFAIAALAAVSLSSFNFSAKTAPESGAQSIEQKQDAKSGGLRPSLNGQGEGERRAVRVIPLFNTPADQTNLLRR